ncbi:MAG: FkbM family methyltransferase [Pseudonocardia sp.]
MASKLAYRLRNALRQSGFELVRNSPSGNLLSLHLSHLFTRYGINCVLDVGARQGEFGRWLRGTGFRGRIVSFEPVESNLGPLRVAAGSDPEWQVEPCALGSSDTTSTINVTHYTHFSSFRTLGALAAEKFGEHSRVVGTQDVRVRRLDEIFDEVTKGIALPSVYLKMDTQGWDLEVLRGAEGRLSRVIALQSEMSFQALYVDMPSFDEAWKTVQGYGYTMSGMFPVTVDDDLRLVEADCVAIRQDR